MLLCNYHCLRLIHLASSSHSNRCQFYAVTRLSLCKHISKWNARYNFLDIHLRSFQFFLQPIKFLPPPIWHHRRAAPLTPSQASNSHHGLPALSQSHSFSMCCSSELVETVLEIWVWDSPFPLRRRRSSGWAWCLKLFPSHI